MISINKYICEKRSIKASEQITDGISILDKILNDNSNIQVD